jgi:hypothetical protein
MPKVYNKYHGDAPETAVYIGRPSKWGNPFSISPGQPRDVCVERYREYLQQRPELRDMAKRELKGKDLVCFCKPRACHGDVLLEVVNAE